MNDSSDRPTLPYLFLVGCPRSGTTLLQRMLDNHPQLAVANETYFIPRCLPHDADERDPLLTPEIIERVRSYWRFPKFRLPEEAVREAAADAATYTEFVSALYVQFARMQRKPLAGEKAPDIVRRLPLLHDLFP